MPPEVAAVVFGLISAVSWGIADFNGGMATRRAPVLTVVLLSQSVGFVLIVALALLRAEAAPTISDLIWGAAAGLIGLIGLVALYRAMAIGQMGIAAPVGAVLAAGLPAVFSAFTQGLPDNLHLFGFAVALAGVFLISRSQGTSGRPAGFGLAIIAGIGFGGFLILIAQVHHNSVFWPLASARIASISAMIAYSLVRRAFTPPSRAVAPIIVAAGIMDVGGNAFFVLAEQAGRLDIAAVLSSLYPASTVLLAFLILKERMTRSQNLGIALALAAIPLIAAKT